MQDKRKILSIEKCLGFKWPRGLSREKECLRIPSLKALLDELDTLKVAYVDYSGNELRSSPEFERKCEDLFECYGPDLWPPTSVDRSAWSVDPELNDLDGLYKHKLHYDVELERVKLHRGFQDMLCEKVLRFHENERQRLRREAALPSTPRLDDSLDASTNSQSLRMEAEQEEYKADYTDTALRREVSSRQRTGSTPSQPATLLYQQFAPVVPMMSTTEASHLPDGEDAAEDRNWDPMIGIYGQQDINPFSLVQDNKKAHYQHGDELHCHPVDQWQPSSADDTVDLRRPMSRKHSRSQGDNGGFTPRKTQKRAQVYNFDHPTPKLLVKLKLTSQKLASITDNESAQRDKPAVMSVHSAGLEEEHGLPASHAKDGPGLQSIQKLPYQQQGGDTYTASRDNLSAAQGHLARELGTQYEAASQDGQAPQSRTPSKRDKRRQRKEFRSTEGCSTVSDPVAPVAELQDVIHVGKAPKEPSSFIIPERHMPFSDSNNEVSNASAPSTRYSMRPDGIHLSDEAETQKVQTRVIDLTSETDNGGDEDQARPAPTVARRSDEHASLGPSSPQGLRIKAEDPVKHETKPRSNEPKSALERARVSVYWDQETDCPAFIVLHRCKTYEDFFDQLRHHRPSEFQDRSIKAAQIRLTNAEALGIAESPNCRMPEDDGEGAFENLTDVLGEHSSEVKAKLKVIVEFRD